MDTWHGCRARAEENDTRRRAYRMATKWRAWVSSGPRPAWAGAPGLEESRNLKSHICIKVSMPSGNRELSFTSSLPLIPEDGNPDCHGIDVIKRWVLCKNLIRLVRFHPSTQLLIRYVAAILTVFRFNWDRSFHVWMLTSYYNLVYCWYTCNTYNTCNM
jgi:hypothetical protein